MNHIVCVAPDRIAEIWPHVRPFIENAFHNGRGDDDAETVHRDLLSGFSLLWIAWDEAQATIAAAATTKLIDVARGKVCLVTACGGSGIQRWAHGLAAIEAYARAEGCRYVRFEGRKGFKRVFRDYRQPWIVLEKRL